MGRRRRRRRRRKHMKTCSLRAKTSVLKWTPEPGAAAAALLCWRCPLQHRTHTNTYEHTHAYMKGLEEWCWCWGTKKNENICKKSFSLRTGPPPSSSQPAGPHFILQFSSMLSSHDDNTRLVVSLALLLTSWLVFFFFLSFRPHFGHPLTHFSRFSGTPGLFTKAVN